MTEKAQDTATRMDVIEDIPWRYSRIPEDQEQLIADLAARHPGLRFTTGFTSCTPMIAEGRIGRRYFHFRFRWDCASLQVGFPENRTSARDRRRALRTLRRRVEPVGEWTDDNWTNGFMELLARNDLRKGNRRIDAYPSRLTAQAAIGGVTGEAYAGFLPPEKAAEIFSELVDRLEPASRRPGRHIRGLMRGSRTAPMYGTRNVITKHARKKNR